MGLNKENYEDKKGINPEDIFDESQNNLYNNYSSDYPSSPDSIISSKMSPVYPNSSYSFFAINENPLIPTTVSDVIESSTPNVSSTNRSFDTGMQSSVLSPTPSMNDWDMQDEVANTTQDDLNAFSSIQLPPLPDDEDDSLWIEADGTRQRKIPGRHRLKIKSKPMDEEDYSNSSSNSINLPLSLMSRFAVLFFMFLFIQVLACIFVFDTGEEIHLFEFTISSTIFSLISLVL